VKCHSKKPAKNYGYQFTVPKINKKKNRIKKADLKNIQTCKPCLCTFFESCVNFFLLPAISSVKVSKRLVQEKYIKFRSSKLLIFFQVLKKGTYLLNLSLPCDCFFLHRIWDDLVNIASLKTFFVLACF
jgi:hypothetical protein